MQVTVLQHYFTHFELRQSDKWAKGVSRHPSTEKLSLLHVKQNKLVSGTQPIYSLYDLHHKQMCCRTITTNCLLIIIVYQKEIVIWITWSSQVPQTDRKGSNQNVQIQRPV